MLFAFVLGNHNEDGQETLYDIMGAIGGQLVDLGHTVVRHDERLVPGHMNILIEAFERPYAARLKAAKEDGSEFVIIMTERPGKPGFNDSGKPHMVERQLVFPLCAPHAAAVWCLVPGVSRWVKRFNPRAADLELGYSETRMRAIRVHDDPIFDFCFFGSMTPRRKNIIAAFNRRGYSVYNFENTVKMQSQLQRDNLVAQCRVVLGIDPFPKWKIVSNSRLATALTLGRPVLAEPADKESPWGRVGVFSKSHGSFVDEAIAMLNVWKDVRDQQLAKFKEFFSPEACVGNAIKETGILESR